jgi:PD-(D/E)XK nuclease superfamily
MSALDKLEHLSFNALNDFGNCLRLGYEKRLSPELVPEIRDSARDRGKLAHKMRELHLHAISRQESTDGIPAKALALEPQTAADYEEATQIYERWKTRWTISAEDLFAVERFGSVNIEGVPLPIIGYDDDVYFDRATNEYVIDDAKTGHAATITPDNEFQLDLAAVRFEGEYEGTGRTFEHDAPGIRTQIDFMRSGVIRTREWNDERREAVKARTRAIWATVVAADKSGEWPATPGAHCAYCPVLAACAAAKLADGVGLIVTDASGAENALRHRILFSEAASRLTDVLRPWVADHGSVAVGGAQARFSGSESRIISDVSAAMDRLEPAERTALEPELKLGYKKKAVKNLLDDPRLADLIKTKINPPKLVFTGTSDDLPKAEGEDDE